MIVYCLLTLAFLCAHILLWARERYALAAAAHALACACPLRAAWMGMDFSPSFTMMFLVANLILCAAGEWIALIGLRPHAVRKGAIHALSGALFAAGMLFSLPSAYIYAVGDDKLSLCVRGALVAGILGAAGIALLWRGTGRRAGFPGAILNGFTLSAACFALGCGTRSPALLPYGAGLLLMTVARQFDAREGVRATLFCLGLVSASVFPVAPML